MIQVKLFYQDKILNGIECSGHSGSASKGQDIICAAVSALMHSLILGLDDVARVKSAKYFIDDKVPIMRITWPVNESENLSLLTLTIAESLKQIARQNPEFVKVKFNSEVSK